MCVCVFLSVSALMGKKSAFTFIAGRVTLLETEGKRFRRMGKKGEEEAATRGRRHQMFLELSLPLLEKGPRRSDTPLSQRWDKTGLPIVKSSIRYEGGT